MRTALERLFVTRKIEINSDLLAAARALCGHEEGIACILGTGSNSCLFNGKKIVENTPSLGYVLGDEGSGAALGKAFIADFVKDMLPDDIASEFSETYGLDYPSIVRKVYREPSPSAFLASFAPFLLERLGHPYVRSLVRGCMEAFIDRSLARYADAGKKKVGVAGSFGCACEEILRETGASRGLEFVRFIKSPIEELVRYHGI